MHRASAAGYEPAPGTRTTLPAGAPGRSRTAFSRLRNERVTVNASGARWRPATPAHHRAVAGLLVGAPCESRTRVTGLEDRVLTVRTTVRESARGESNPHLRLGEPACGLEHLERETKWKPRAESNRFLPRLQLGAFPLGDSAVAEETGRVEPPGPWPARLARECAKPACTSSPSRKAEGSNLSGSAPRPGFSGPVAGHSAAPSSSRTRGWASGDTVRG